MRDIIELWNGKPSEDKCPKCYLPYYPVMICPKCGYKTVVTNVCRKCMVSMLITGWESHFCLARNRVVSRKIKGYVNQGTIYELKKDKANR